MKKEELQQNMKDRMQQFEDGGLRLLKKGQKGIVHSGCGSKISAFRSIQSFSPSFVLLFTSR